MSNVTNYIDTNLSSSRTFKSLMEQAIELSSGIKVLQEEYDDVREKIDGMLGEAGVESTVSYNGWKVAVIDKPAKPRVDYAKLLRLLGPKGPSLFKQAMIPGKASHYVQITPPSATEERE